MTQLEFTAIGTAWAVLLDHQLTLDEEQKLLSELQEMCSEFDQKYSRFLPESWLTRLRKSDQSKHEHTLDAEALELFRLGVELEQITEGHFTLNIADELSQLGYDSTYSLQPKDQKLAPRGKYWLKGNTLHTQGRVSFDLGAYGKGFLIDLLTKSLLKNGFEFFLVDGSGDFFGTTKANGSAWNIGLEHPQQAEMVIGTYQLHNQGFASSGLSQRRWPGGHHLLNGKSNQPTTKREMVFVSAATACLADALSTALFVTPSSFRHALQKRFSPTFCIVENTQSGLQFQRSLDFSGLFQDN